MIFEEAAFITDSTEFILLINELSILAFDTNRFSNELWYLIYEVFWIDIELDINEKR